MANSAAGKTSFQIDNKQRKQAFKLPENSRWYLKGNNSERLFLSPQISKDHWSPKKIKRFSGIWAVKTIFNTKNEKENKQDHHHPFLIHCFFHQVFIGLADLNEKIVCFGRRVDVGMILQGKLTVGAFYFITGSSLGNIQYGVIILWHLNSEHG